MKVTPLQNVPALQNGQAIEVDDDIGRKLIDSGLVTRLPDGAAPEEPSAKPGTVESAEQSLKDYKKRASGSS